MEECRPSNGLPMDFSPGFKYNGEEKGEKTYA